MIVSLLDSRRVFFVILLLIRKLVNADYVASIPSCGTGYLRINNGCYNLVNGTTFTYEAAAADCAIIPAGNTVVVKGHLIAFESEAETISLSFWLKGYGYMNDFWIDGVMSTNHGRLFEWSQHVYTTFGYLKFTTASDKYTALIYNSTQYYEIVHRNGMQQYGYICEGQVYCQASDDVCMNGGTCYVNSGRAICVCVPGYVGVLCEQLVDNCLSSPCLHNGNCTNAVNNYTCTCTEFYKGESCETEVTNALATARTVALGITTGIVCLIILILCLMDLPLALIMKKLGFNKNKTEADNKDEDKKSIFKNFGRKPVEEPSKSVLTSEEEMLRRFKSALNQTRKPRTPSAAIY